MPGWVADQIDLADYVGYLQAPVGTWEGKTYRISIDGDCHTLNSEQTTSEMKLAKAWKDEVMKVTGKFQLHGKKLQKFQNSLEERNMLVFLLMVI